MCTRRKSRGIGQEEKLRCESILCTMSAFGRFSELSIILCTEANEVPLIVHGSVGIVMRIMSKSNLL